MAYVNFLVVTTYIQKWAEMHRIEEIETITTGIWRTSVPIRNIKNVDHQDTITIKLLEITKGNVPLTSITINHIRITSTYPLRMTTTSFFWHTTISERNANNKCIGKNNQQPKRLNTYTPNPHINDIQKKQLHN